MKLLPDRDAKRRTKEIYALAQFVLENPNIKASDMQKNENLTPTCRTSYFYYLNEAIENGWIQRNGNTRAVRYSATDQFAHHEAMVNLSRPVANREKIRYQPEFLHSYEPNETFYLSENQRKSLNAACGKGAFNAGDSRVAKQVRRFMADLTHNSSAFEGVDIKYADTISFLEKNIKSRHMSINDAVILRNHYNAIRFVIDNAHYPAQETDVSVTAYDTRNIHAYLSDGLLEDKRQQGRLRYSHVEIRESAYIPPDIPGVIQHEFEMMMNKAQKIKDPYEQAVFLLIHIPYQQPFDDCNKRTSRLVCNIPLLKSGILPVSWAEVNHRDYTDSLLCIYEKNSTYGLCDVFVEACKRSFERFEISLAHREPTRLEITHSVQIKDSVRRRILHGDSSLPRDLDPLKVGEYEVLVHEILAGIRENEFVASPYDLRGHHVQAWLTQEAADAAPKDIPFE